MTLSIYRPMRMSDVMNRLFADPYLRRSPYYGDYTNDAYVMPLDVIAKEDEFVIMAAVPGLKPEDLSVEVLGETVTLKGTVSAPAEDEKTTWLLQERQYGRFSRTLNFPVELNGAKADASIEDGILTLRIPKSETAKPKTIKVTAK